MNIQLEIKHLKLIKAIVEEGSVIKASEQLNVTQSALSHQLKDIEQKLNTLLFLRLNKRLILTSAGEKLYQSANKILSSLERLENDVRHLGADKKGILRISTECYTCYHWLPSVLKIFSQKFPDVVVQIIAEATRKPIEALIEGKIDLAIVSSKIQDKNFLTTPLFIDELVAIVSLNHPLSSRKYLKAEDFKEQMLFTYSQEIEELSVFQMLLLPNRIKPKQVIKVELTEAVIEMVKADLGIAVLARWSVQPHLDSGSLKAIPLTKKGLFREWNAVRFIRQPSFPYLVYFIDLCGAMKKKNPTSLLEFPSPNFG